MTYTYMCGNDKPIYGYYETNRYGIFMYLHVSLLQINMKMGRDNSEKIIPTHTEQKDKAFVSPEEMYVFITLKFL